jgi:hypothetical protein
VSTSFEPARDYFSVYFDAFLPKPLAKLDLKACNWTGRTFILRKCAAVPLALTWVVLYPSKSNTAIVSSYLINVR